MGSLTEELHDLPGLEADGQTDDGGYAMFHVGDRNAPTVMGQAIVFLKRNPDKRVVLTVPDFTKRTCGECDEALPEQANYCPQCGSEVND